jgi:hypothetical protein
VVLLLHSVGAAPTVQCRGGSATAHPHPRRGPHPPRRARHRWCWWRGPRERGGNGERGHMGHERGARGIAGAGRRAGRSARAGWLAGVGSNRVVLVPPAPPCLAGRIRFFFSFLGGTKCTGAGNAGGLLLLSCAAVDPSPPRPPHVGVVARDGRRRGPAEPRDRERRAAANPEGPNPTPLSDDGGMATDRKCLWPCDSPTKAK